MKIKKILLVSGCSLGQTPIVAAYASYVKKSRSELTVVEFDGVSRAQFLAECIRQLFNKCFDLIVCFNPQSTPVLFIVSWLGYARLVYWKLESPKAGENLSIAANIGLLEYVTRKKNIELVLPSEERVSVQSPPYRRTSVIYNAPLEPYIRKAEVGRRYDENSLSLVLYGTFSDPASVYLQEWIKFCTENEDFELTVVGRSLPPGKVRSLNRLCHVDLIKTLCDQQRFAFSIVGYKDTNQCNRLAAPNKLIESVSCGLPVIGHSKNDYVARIITKYNCGVLIDFDEFTAEELKVGVEKYKQMISGALHAAECLCLSATLCNSPLLQL